MATDEMQLEMLPEDVLWMIVSWLPLADLKSLSLTSKGLKAYADKAIAKRENVFLNLNKSQFFRPQRISLTVIDKELLTRSERPYRNVAMVLVREIIPECLTNVLNATMNQCPIRKMRVVSHHPTPVAALLRTGEVSTRISNLKVLLMMKYCPLNYIETWIHMPALTTLSWLEDYRWTPPGPMNRVNMVAPQLRSLRQSTGNLNLPRTLSICEFGSPTQVLLVDNGYRNLRTLVAVLNNDFLDAMNGRLMPYLNHFECTIVSSAAASFWRSLHRYMPNITYLKVRTVMDVWSGDTFARCTQLRTLILTGGHMTYSSGAIFEVPNLRQLCLVNCRLPDERGTLEFLELETLCLVGCYRRSDQQDQQIWNLPRLRHLCIEAPDRLGSNIRLCEDLEYCRMIFLGRMLQLPWPSVFNHLTTLQVDCRWPECGDSLGQILSRAPNLQNLMLLLQGCPVNVLTSLPQWCPRLQSITIQSQRRMLTIEHDILRVIFSLPAIKEIVLGTMKVTGVNTSITVPRQLRVLIIQVLFCELTDLPLFAIDDDHPKIESKKFLPLETFAHRYYTINESRRKTHLRWMNRSDPFKCSHSVNACDSWLKGFMEF